MRADIAVSGENLSKLYLLYNKPVDRLKQSLFGRLGRNYARTFWALQDVSFQVKRGEAFGIIGRNGSGKSTLLQIIAGILQPTQGIFRVTGRLAALLELGAGFNPEFTGRENIYLNGATLGISEKDMRKKQDEIIDFAQIGEFIDQPVKIYSSGMFVRLAFGIATSIDPDVLVIDEALSVGDAGFVMKCMNRMNKMREQGATILLVTHDVQTVRSFCDNAMWLNEGRVQNYGSPLDITGRYLQFLFEGDHAEANNIASPPTLIGDEASSFKQHLLPSDYVDLSISTDLVRWGSGELQIETCFMANEPGKSKSVFEYGKSLHIEIQARAKADIPSQNIGFGFAFRNIKGLDIITHTTYDQNYAIPTLHKGQVVRMYFNLENILAPGDYALVLNAENRDQAQPHYYDFIENAIIFKVVSLKPIFSLVLPSVYQRIDVE